ncbi:hypothetical protein WI80_09455 [Burkholderia ubonensis]|uniref:hypothetical protein n=1 Tax=Burkholderia TaxID=32008 RepID=UPI0005AC6CD1|nr:MULTISPECIES: hypothetical protein [Burkholderia]KIP17355.1 putative wcbD [Burkholderia sp. MSHR3999]KVD13339.1 hypothetical protein WI80_09455 [Burkholderia ubonensis]KVU16583.1 hypothetical protein WK63_13625 [Burkholderia ubonensis]
MSLINRSWRSSNKLLFSVTVVVPTLLASIYFGMVASDVYVSESRFVVRSQQRQENGALLSTFLQGTSFGRSLDDAWIVTDYIESMDALRTLDRNLPLRKWIGRPNGDVISRFPQPGGDESYESLLRYYRNRIVAVVHDSTSSITTLRVSSFDSRSAQAINENLLTMSEALVNELNRRGLEDGMRYANDSVRDAQRRVTESALALARYRSDAAVFDPDRQSSLRLQQIGRLQDELLAARAKLAEIAAVAPANPQVDSLKMRIAVIRDEIDAASNTVTGKGTNSFAAKSRDFERLSIEKGFAERELASALTLQEQARNEASKKQLYIARVVQPGLPDAPEEPKRLRAILVTFTLGLVTWGILSLLLFGVREHTLQ